MKLEKREITLNEFDSLKDVFYMEKTLLWHYVEAFASIERKEVKTTLLQLLKETAEDMCFIKELMRGSGIENR